MKRNLIFFKPSLLKGAVNYFIVTIMAILILGGNTTLAQISSELWRKEFPGENQFVTDLIIEDDGSVTMVAERGYQFIRLNKDGNIIVRKTYSGPSSDEVKKIIKTSDGGYLLVGSSSSGIGNDKTAPNKSSLSYRYDMWVVKVSSDGTKLWDQSYGGELDDYLSDVVATKDGGFLLFGSSNSGISGDKSEACRPGKDSFAPTNDFWLVKINGNGVKQWDKTYGGGDGNGVKGWGLDDGVSIVASPDGGYLLGGTSMSSPAFEKSDMVKCIDCNNRQDVSDFWIIKITEDGEKEWDKTVGGYRSERLVSMIAAPGGYLLAGSSMSDVSGDRTSVLKFPYYSWMYEQHWIVKVNNQGNRQWDQSYRGKIEGLIGDETGFYSLNFIDRFEIDDPDFPVLIYSHYSLNKMDWNSAELWGNEFKYYEDSDFYGSTNAFKKRIDGSIVVSLTGYGIYPRTTFVHKLEESPAQAGLIVEYFSKTNLEKLLYNTYSDKIDYDWGAQSPGYNVPVDSFSARWSGRLFTFYRGEYTFTITADDGARLWLDDKLIIDNWTANKPVALSQKITLKAGLLYDLKLEYNETTGNAHVKLEWQRDGYSKEVVPAHAFSQPETTPTTGLYSNYFNGQNFEQFVFQRRDREINFNWGLSSPAPEVNKDNFSVRWVGQIQPEFSETYTFKVSSDNGMRLWIDNRLIIDNWIEQQNKIYTGTIALKAEKKVDIRLEYFEGSGGAACNLQWQSASQPLEVVPRQRLFPEITLKGDGLTATYYNGQNFETEVLRRNELHIDHYWLDGSPHPTVDKDNFSARWTGYILAPTTGAYTFYVSSSNGHKLWVNNQLIIDKWTNEGNINLTGIINLVAGEKYPIKLEYFNSSGGAFISLYFKIYSDYEYFNTRVNNPFYNDNFSTTIAASVYQNCNYRGYKVDLAKGQYTLAALIEKGIKNDDISSLKVTPGYKIILYQNNNFRGTPFGFTEDDPCLVDNQFNDLCSSIRIEAIGNLPPQANMREGFEEIKWEEKNYAVPNPFANETSIFIDETDGKEVGLRIFNTTGRQVKNVTTKVYNGRLTIGKDLSSGLYVVNIQTGKANKLFKIIKQ